jgi:hypothetical protein
LLLVSGWITAYADWYVYPEKRYRTFVKGVGLTSDILADPLTWHLTGEFEKMGFFFAGVLPQSQVGDALVLQYLNNVAFDYNKLVLYSDFTKEIMEYIRRNDPNEII